jgi:hypothetical protein
MPGITRTQTDTAGGTIITSNKNTSVYLEGQLVAVKGDFVGSPAHHMVQASTDITIGAVGVVRAGDLSDQGTPATGSTKAFGD